MKKIKEKGIDVAEVTLYISYATFNPVIENDIRKHRMYKELFEIDEKNCKIINNAINKKKKIIAVGTTVLRTLETVYLKYRKIFPIREYTDLYIYPGYKFKIVDELITNFHMPKTSLFILVCAFADIENIKRAYSESIKNRYRFLSFGDAMYIK